MFLYPLSIYKIHTYEDPKLSALIRNAAEDAYEIGLNRGYTQLADRLRKRMAKEIETYRHPYSSYENYPGYMSVIEMLLEELGAANGNS